MHHAPCTMSKSEGIDLLVFVVDIEYMIACALLVATGLTLAGEEKLALFIGGPVWLYSLVASGIEHQRQKMGPGFPEKAWDETKLVFGFSACLAITIWNLVTVTKEKAREESELRAARRARKEAKAKHQ
mmetsp:Transcript_15279/g.35375  ORF Transcript_15279/g.35375 Transcript_15279/m.35375 type:complete len:129 (+) Transcript_15279:1-387(+)